MKKLKNVLICEPKQYKFFSQFNLPKLYKTLVGRRKYGDLTVHPDYHCDLNRAYLLDSKGIMHTIIIKGDK